MAGKAISHSDAWWVSEHRPAHILRCTASLKSTGTQCKREAAVGTNVCNQHGALVPAVQAAAARRIGMSVDDAVKTLLGMLSDPQVDARTKATILHDLLDRGGLGATQKHLVGIGQVDPIEKLFNDLLTVPGMLMDPNASPSEPNPEFARFNAEALDDEYTILDAEVIEDDVPARQPSTTLRQIEAAPTTGKVKVPKRIREAMAELL